MKTLSMIYWTRVLLGIFAALISTLMSTIMTDINLFNGLTAALAVYIVTYYIYKSRFAAKVEKPTKIFTMGILYLRLMWM